MPRNNEENGRLPTDRSRFVKPYRNVSLLPQTVEVWRLKFDELIGEIDILGSWLSADEVERAASFHFDGDRQRYKLARGALRILLANYLNHSPGEIALSYSEYGKPTVASPASGRKLSFNLAHSNNLAIFAFTHEMAVGVDVEWERPLDDMHQIARRFFAPAEFAAWEKVEEALKEHAFYLAWTRKEAFIKAIGEGLSYPLDQFQVTLEPSRSARLLKIAGDSIAAQKWSLHDLQVGKGYSAALAVAGGGYAIRCWHYTRDWMADYSDGD